MKKNRVVELFAGVGGFRIGLNHVTLEDGIVHESDNWKVVFTNQWEPSTKIQHAFECYKTRFGVNENLILRDYENISITDVPSEIIPDHELLVGGFPCQDYSVARSLKNEGGIEGKKGVLWWEIDRIVKDKKPKFVLLENVDRLLKSPSTQRGRDFGIMLRSFNDNGYDVEWRVINAAEYGFPQRRRRVFIFAYRRDIKYAINLKELTPNDIINTKGLFQSVFPTKVELNSKQKNCYISSEDTEMNDLLQLSSNFSFIFENSGMMKDGAVYTVRSVPNNDNINFTVLRDIVEANVSDIYYLSEHQKSKVDYLRSYKRLERTGPTGLKYFYSEGAMSPIDDLNLPARTMLTSEGSINRSTHIIMDRDTNNIRFLTAIEAERINMFPDNWTNINSISYKKRLFIMGNALVTGIIAKLGDEISKFK